MCHVAPAPATSTAATIPGSGASWTPGDSSVPLMTVSRAARPVAGSPPTMSSVPVESFRVYVKPPRSNVTLSFRTYAKELVASAVKVTVYRFARSK